ncbi:MAG: sulfatase-like hydrolase/transferase, partial [Anaerolineae bacterium]|nr:sulfatase-like hydrolase/transferase [Anaerolineae bacterium]
MAKQINGQLTRRGFLGMTAATAGTLAFGQGAAGARLNLVCILTDDQRWDALHYMGNPVIQTPNLDKLAAKGVTFENNFATTAICMSSRASILTGLHTATHGLDDFAKP